MIGTLLLILLFVGQNGLAAASCFDLFTTTLLGPSLPPDSERLGKLLDAIQKPPSYFRNRKIQSLVYRAYDSTRKPLGITKRLLANPASPSKAWSEWTEAKFQFRVERLAFRVGAKKTLLELGLIADHDTAKGLSSFMQRYSNWIRTSIAAIVGASAAIASNLPVYLPEYRFVETKLLAKPELLDKIFLDGFDTHRSEIESYLQRPFLNERRVNFISRSFSAIIIGYILHQTYFDLHAERSENVLSVIDQLAEKQTPEQRALELIQSEIEFNIQAGSGATDPNSQEMRAKFAAYLASFKSTATQ